MSVSVEAPVRPPRVDGISADDFETASIHSAAPSYFSDAPSYHSTLPEPVPPYTPRATPPYTPTHNLLLPAPSAPRQPMPLTQDLPPIQALPPAPRNSSSRPLSLSHFQTSPWPSLNSSPNARIYHSIAQRRVTRSYENAMAARPAALERVSETQEEDRLRPLEDPHLVGEEAASRAREARLERERVQDLLIDDGNQWDQFLFQVRNWGQHERCSSINQTSLITGRSRTRTQESTGQRRGGLLRGLNTLRRFM